MEQSNISLLVEQYISSGIGVLVPLPEGKKYPPREGTTGNIPEQPADEARGNFEGEGDNFNVALRVADNVIAIDVDNYGTKTGADTLATREAELGKLPETVYNTRHGEGAESRHLFYRVPAGVKWVSKIGSSIEIVQKTHRYSVVAPSEYEGMSYTWYNTDSEVPHIDELAELPKAWIEFLYKQPLDSVLKHSPAKSFGDDEATQWLESVAPDYDAEVPEPSQGNLNRFIDAMADNAHDNAVNGVRWAVRHAVVDGAPGLKKTLDELEKAFTVERKKRSKGESADREFARLLSGEVNALRGAIEAGAERPLVAVAGSGMSKAITELLGGKKAGIQHSALVEKVRSIITDYQLESAMGKLFALAVPSALGIVSETSDTEIFNEDQRAEMRSEHLTAEIESKVIPLVKMAYYAVPDNADEDQIEEVTARNKEIANLIRCLGTERSLKAITLNLAVALKEQNRVVKRDDIDSQENLLGLADGRVVDLNLATAGCSIADVIRDREKGELVTKKLGIDPEKAAAALAHRRKHYRGKDRKAPAELFLELAFPNPEVRRVAQKLLGYAAFGYMESQYRNIPVFMGPSSSGKTVLTSLIREVAGSYYGSVGIEALSKEDDVPNSALANVIHSRWLFMTELSSANTAASARLKAVASGEGVSATFKYRNETLHSSTITPIIVTNDAPSMTIDDAILKRLVVVPMTTKPEVLEEKLPKPNKGELFRRDVYGEATDSSFFKDDENKAYMLGWILHGYVLMKEEGIDQSTMPIEIQEAITQFVGEADPVEEWLRSLDYSDPTAQSTRTRLGNDFRLECPDSKFPSGAILKKLLARKGAAYKKTMDGATYVGVQVPEDRERKPVSMDNHHLHAVK